MFTAELRRSKSKPFRMIAGRISLSILLVTVGSSSALAAIPPQKQLVMFTPYGPHEIEAPEAIVDYDLVSRIIPLNLHPDAESELVPRILDHSFRNLLNAPGVQASVAGQAVKTLESGIKTDLTLESEDSETAHNLSFQVLAVQREAKFDYTGFTKAQLRLNFAASTLSLEVRERINQRQEVIIQHRQDVLGSSLQNVAWRYRW